MMSIDREQVKALTRKSKDLMDVWVRERKEMLAKQLVANAEIKKSWMDSNPIEVSQSQRGYNANAEVRVSIEVEPEP